MPPPVEPAHQRYNACPESRVVLRLQSPNLIGGKRSLLFSSRLIDKHSRNFCNDSDSIEYSMGQS